MNVLFDDLVDGIFHQMQDRVVPAIESVAQKASQQISERLQAPPASTDLLYITDRLIVLSQPARSSNPQYLDTGRDVRRETRRTPWEAEVSTLGNSSLGSSIDLQDDFNPQVSPLMAADDSKDQVDSSKPDTEPTEVGKDTTMLKASSSVEAGSSVPMENQTTPIRIETKNGSNGGDMEGGGRAEMFNPNDENDCLDKTNEPFVHPLQHESTIKNSPGTIVSYLDKRHGVNHYLAFSLMDEQPDDRSLLLFRRQIVQLGWWSPCIQRSEAPSISKVLKICYSLHSYLQLDPANVALVYCSNGKTRTAISIACYLKFAGLVQQSYQGFFHFLQKRGIENPEATWKQLPPSLRLFFRQFDSALDMGGFLNQKPLFLRAIALQGVPVDDKPCLDIWDSSQRHVFSSHPEMWGSDLKAAKKNESSQWVDEEGFYKVNVVLEGDFLLLCRFGGEFAGETTIHDPSKILFRYTNTTGFLSGGCPYELPPDKVDLTRSYAGHLDDEDFLVTLLFEADWEQIGTISPTGDHSLRNELTQQLNAPGKECRERIWQCHEPNASQEGFRSMFHCHSARPDPSDIEDFRQIYRAQSVEACPSHLICLALQLTNFNYKQAEHLLLESSSLSWWRLETSNNSTDGGILAPPEEKKDPGHGSNLEKDADSEMAQNVFDVLDEIDVTKYLDQNDISIAGEPTQALRRAETMMVSQATPKRRNGSFRSQPRALSVDLCTRDSGWMVPTLRYPRQGDVVGRFGSSSKSPAYVQKDAPTLASLSLPRVPYLPHEGPALFPSSSKRQRIGSPVSYPEQQIPPYDRTREVATQKFMELRHSGVTLAQLMGLLETSQAWSNVPAEMERIDHAAATNIGEVDSDTIHPVVSKEASMNRKSKEQKEKEWEEARKVEEKGKAKKKVDQKMKDENEHRPKGADGEVPLKDDPDYAKYFKMLKMGMSKEQVVHALKRDDKDPRVLELDPNLSLESQVPDEPKTADGDVPLKDDPEYGKYFKMLKMGLPMDAVKNAMIRDGKDPSTMDLDPEKSEKSQRASSGSDNGVPLKDDPDYAKYFKMQSMGLPVDAVKNALTRDGKDPGIMDLDPNMSLKSQQASSQDSGVPLKDDPDYSKYFKMLSMGLPLDAVKNALTRDGKDPSIMDLDPKKSLQFQLGKSDDQDVGIPLKNDPDYAKYFKMQSMGLPIDAVKNALARDGKDPGIMDMDTNKSVAYQKKAPATVKRSPMKKKKRIRRKKIYWNPINPAELKEDSMWNIVKDAINMTKLHYDQKEFEELFTESADPKDKKNKKKEKSAKKLVQVIDAKRSMNGGIILARLKMEYSKVAEIVTKMDHNKFDSTQLTALKDYLADADERRGLIGYMQNSKFPRDALYADLSETEKYMVTMMEVPEPARKFDAMLFRSVFKNRFEDINAGIQTLNTACDQLRASEKFRKLMAMILTVVNQINTGGEGNMAIGFTLDALLKLNEAKAFDKKTSVLHYVVKLVKKNNESLLTFSNDISSVIPAESVLLDGLGSDAKALGKELVGVHETVQEEAQRLEEAGELKPMSLEDLKEQKTTVRQVGRIAQFNKIDHHTGRTSMERFTVNAHYSCEQANLSIEDVERKYTALLSYFGEDENMASGDFFGILRRFMREFQKAVDQVEAIEKKEAKERKRAAAKAAKAAKKATSKDTTTNDRMGRARRSRKKVSTQGVTAATVSHALIPDSSQSKEQTKSDLLAAMVVTAKSRQKTQDPADPLPKPSLNGGIASMAAAAAARGNEDKVHGDREGSILGVSETAAIASSGDQAGLTSGKGKTAGEGVAESGVANSDSRVLYSQAGAKSPLSSANKITEVNSGSTEALRDLHRKDEKSVRECVVVLPILAPPAEAKVDNVIDTMIQTVPPSTSSQPLADVERKDANSSKWAERTVGSAVADQPKEVGPNDMHEVGNDGEGTQKFDAKKRERDLTLLSDDLFGDNETKDDEKEDDELLRSTPPKQSTIIEPVHDVIDQTTSLEVAGQPKEPETFDTVRSSSKEGKALDQATFEATGTVKKASGSNRTALVDATESLPGEQTNRSSPSPASQDDAPKSGIVDKATRSDNLIYDSGNGASASVEPEKQTGAPVLDEANQRPATSVEKRNSGWNERSAKISVSTEGKSDFASKAAAYRKRRKKAGKDRSKSPSRMDRSKSPSGLDRSKSPSTVDKSNVVEHATAPEDPSVVDLFTPTRQSRFLKSASEYRQKKSSRNLVATADPKNGSDKASSLPTDESHAGSEHKHPATSEAKTDNLAEVAPLTAKTPLGQVEKTSPLVFANSFLSPMQAQRSSIRLLNPLGASNFLDSASTGQAKVGRRLGDFLDSDRGVDHPRLGDFLEDDQSEMLRQNFDDSSVAQIADRLHKKPTEARMSTSWTEGDNITNWMGWADQVIKASDSDSVVGFEMPRDLNDPNDFDDDSTIASHSSYASSYFDDLSVASGIQTPGRVSSYISFDIPAVDSSFDPYYDDAETPEYMKPGISGARDITPAKVAASILFEDSPPTSVDIALGDHQGYAPYETALPPSTLHFAGDEVGLDAGLAFGADVGFDDGLGGFGGMDSFNDVGDDRLSGLEIPSSAAHLERDREPENKDTENRRKNNSWFPWAGGG